MSISNKKEVLHQFTISLICLLAFMIALAFKQFIIVGGTAVLCTSFFYSAMKKLLLKVGSNEQMEPKSKPNNIRNHG
ncbi:hypothetical protein OKZ62_001878 [Vibrio navarrensis]|nr:hypothetical protein [Vibrio navarrensis]